MNVRYYWNKGSKISNEYILHRLKQFGTSLTMQWMKPWLAYTWIVSKSVLGSKVFWFAEYSQFRNYVYLFKETRYIVIGNT